MVLHIPRCPHHGPEHRARFEDGVVGVLVVAVGDPAAALIGSRCPGPRVWGKSPLGILAFVAASLAVWAILAGAGYGAWSWAVLITAVIAAVVEFLPLPLDDNLTVPLIAGGFMALARTVGL